MVSRFCTGISGQDGRRGSDVQKSTGSIASSTVGASIVRKNAIFQRRSSSAGDRKTPDLCWFAAGRSGSAGWSDSTYTVVGAVAGRYYYQAGKLQLLYAVGYKPAPLVYHITCGLAVSTLIN